MPTPKSPKPKLEDALNELVNGDVLKNALDFVAYLRANKMSPAWTTPNSWKVSCKGQGICYIKLGEQALDNYTQGGNLKKVCEAKHGNAFWLINFHGSFARDYEPLLSSAKLKKIAWANIKHCVKCNENCIAEKKWVAASVLGKDFDNVCKNIRIVMINPNAEAVECAKALVDKSRDDIANGRSVW